uniref:hypothetical protein n=1 Tax=uncultured Deinococcus sp. TaxID=158789 RepID=UPI003747A368
MTFDPEQFISQHGGDAGAALRALNASLEEATRGRDSEGQSAARARRERDEARARAQQLDEQRVALEARVPAEGAVLLNAEQAAQWQQVTERGGLAAWDTDRTAAAQGQQFRQEALITRLAQAQNWDAARLTELLAGRPLDEREITPEGGSPTRVIGLPSGDQFRPAAEAFGAFAPALA